MTADEPFAQALAPGTDVQGYRIRSVLGAGGFGVTYLAEHIAMNHQVALKEFLPSGIAARAKAGDTVRAMSPAHQEDFAWGLMRFREEARTLARLKHHAIVPVLNYFEANGTAYCVMEYVSGQTLDARLGLGGTLDADALARVVPALLDGIEAVHAAGFLHRDIKPANILLNERGAPVLIDFGAARQALGAHSRSLTAILSEGYAPYEQYQRDGDQGPWTDIYALGGTLYRCVTGERPPEATRRIEARIKQRPDPLAPAAQAAAGRYPAPLLAAIDRALAVMEAERPQSIVELRALIDTSAAPAASTLMVGAAPARPPTADARLRPEASLPAAARRRRLWPAMAAVAVLAAGGAAAVYIASEGGRREERRQAALAEQARIAAEAQRKADQEDARRRAAEEEAKRKAADEARRREAQAVTDCDRLAASDDPKFNVGQIAGINFLVLDAEKALAACRAAVSKFPEEPRFRAYLARALYKAKQFAEAHAIARPLAEAGNPLAQTLVGRVLIYGEGVAADAPAGLEWLRKAAGQEYSIAQANLGAQYMEGKIVARDDAEAYRWFRRSAYHGYVAGQHGFAFCYDAGRGVAKDEAEAARWYRKAAEWGYSPSQHALGLMLLNGRGVAKDPKEALGWFRMAADRGNVASQYMIGVVHDREGDLHFAVEWYRKAADAGHAQAQYAMGYVYEIGRGVAADRSQAIAWYLKSAAQGFDLAKKALSRLGVAEQ